MEQELEQLEQILHVVRDESNDYTSELLFSAMRFQDEINDKLDQLEKMLQEKNKNER